MPIPGLTVVTLNEPELTDFAAARNRALAKVKTDWALFLDTDESFSPGLETEIKQAIASQEFVAYYLPRVDTFLGRVLRHGETGQAKFIRLARRNFGRWQRPVHETWVGQGRVGTLREPLLHTPHVSLAAFLTKIDRYSTMDAAYRYKLGLHSSLVHILCYPLGKFKLNYFWRLGILDGVPGLIHALMMSFHSYLTWTKLYLLWHKR